MPSNAMWAGTKILTALDIATNPYTPETTDDGSYIKGTANVGATGKYVLLWDNVNGTGDPLFSYQIRDAIPTQSTQSQLNTEINDIYMQAGTSAVGDYPAIVPIERIILTEFDAQNRVMATTQPLPLAPMPMEFGPVARIPPT